MNWERGQRLACELERFAALEPPFPHWMGGYKDDAGPSYCYPCAEAAVAAGKGEFVDGGYGGTESDSCEHCDTCGCLLDYSLTDYGAMSELDHFQENPPTAPLHPETAFHIARMVAAMPDNSSAIAIAEQAVRAIYVEVWGPRSLRAEI